MDYRQFHDDALVIDSHNDTIVMHIRRGNVSLVSGRGTPNNGFYGVISFTRGERPDGDGKPIQIDFPKMRESGIDAAFFAVDVTLARHNHLAYAMDAFGFLFEDLASHNADVVIVKKSEDILRAKAEGKPAAILAVEHANCTERSLNVVRALYALGIRSIGLTHNVSSYAADGCKEQREGVGLTRFGVRMVQEMNRLGMLVDLAHISPSGFYHALEVSTKPVIFSHGNARALCNHVRNLDDDQLRALARNGGVIGLSYVPMFIDEQAPSFDRLLAHVDHIVEVAGINTLGLGSDFDGGGDQLEDANAVPAITEALLKRGYSESDLRKILGENTLRVLRAAIG